MWESLKLRLNPSQKESLRKGWPYWCRRGMPTKTLIISLYLTFVFCSVMLDPGSKELSFQGCTSGAGVHPKTLKNNLIYKLYSRSITKRDMIK